MSFVSEISEAQAGPELKPIYEKIQKNFGFLPHYFQALGRLPHVIDAHLGIGSTILEDNALGAALKEQVGLVVSGINSSSYCIAIHMELLNRLGVEKALGRKLAVHYPSAPVEEKVQALFRFGDKLTRRPADIEPTDIERLRLAGWSDAEIVEAVLTVAYFNFINRVSFGLGLVAEF